jgi:hypothetical protein
MPLPALKTAGFSSEFTALPAASQKCVMNNIKWPQIIKDEAAKV